MRIKIILCLLSLTGVYGWSDSKQRRFKDDFLFGAGTSAYQVEGAWDTDGKSESIWDRFLHTNPELIADGRNGDIAADSYHQYRRDVELLRELGVDFYRFSISWPRVLPKGFSNEANEKGLEYYDNLIDELLKYNIEPMVTLYHYDLPQNLQDLGGWASPLSIQWFEDYSRVIFERYASKVKYWITINQPNDICVAGYGGKEMAPAVNAKGVGEYICIKNVLLAHANVYRLYEKEFKKKYKGSVGISIALNWIEPLNNSTENVEAAEVRRAFTFGLYMDPIWSKEGDFPKLVKDIVAKKSKEQGFSRSRLPILTPEEKSLLKGSADFLGMNHYTTFQAKPSTVEHPSPSFEDDVNGDLTQSAEWTQAKSFWLKSAPYGIYKLCIHINLNYNYPPIIITEHGWSSDTGLKDRTRADTLREYIKAILYALEDGTDIKGYTAWSLIDNVEWTAGTSERFGLYQVNFESEDKTRKPRLSAHVYKRIIDQRIVEMEWRPDSLRMNISTRRTRKANVEL